MSASASSTVRLLIFQVPANATNNRQSPTSTAQRRRPLVAASKSIQTAHFPAVPRKEAAAGRTLPLPSGHPTAHNCNDASKPTVAARSPHRVATHHQVLSWLVMLRLWACEHVMRKKLIRAPHSDPHLGSPTKSLVATLRASGPLLGPEVCPRVIAVFKN